MASTIDTPLRTRPSLAEIQDKHEIAALLSQYARGVDRKDERLIRDVYHDDAIDNHGSFNGSASEFVTQLMPRLRVMEVCFHGLCHPWIEVKGDIAVAETYFVGFIRMPVPGPDGPMMNMHQFGRYLDRLERRHGLWKIAHRQLVVEDTRFEAPPAGETPAAFRLYMPGAAAPADFAYDRWAELGGDGPAAS